VCTCRLKFSLSNDNWRGMAKPQTNIHLIRQLWNRAEILPVIVYWTGTLIFEDLRNLRINVVNARYGVDQVIVRGKWMPQEFVHEGARVKSYTSFFSSKRLIGSTTRCRCAVLTHSCCRLESLSLTNE
jgi:hypothetical protein